VYDSTSSTSWAGKGHLCCPEPRPHAGPPVCGGACARGIYFLAGDATDDDRLLKERVVDGLSANLEVSVDTLEWIVAFARPEPTVQLSAHDPLAEHRLTELITLNSIVDE
jgi:N-acyl homoserine lactone hydrolase